MSKFNNTKNAQLRMCANKILNLGPGRFYDREGYKRVMNSLDFTEETDSYKECCKMISERNADQKLALLKWYNRMTKKRIAELFQEIDPVLAQAVPYDENKSFIKDIVINGVPVCLKIADFNSLFGKEDFKSIYRDPDNKLGALCYLLRSHIPYIYEEFYRQGVRDPRLLYDYENLPKNLNVFYIVFNDYSWEDNLIMRSDISLIKKCIAERLRVYRECNNGDMDCYMYDNKEYYTDLIFINRNLRSELYE